MAGNALNKERKTDAFWETLKAERPPLSAETVESFFDKHRGKILDTLKPGEMADIDKAREALKEVTDELLSAMDDLMHIVDSETNHLKQEFREPEMQKLYEHYGHIKKYAFIITKKIETQGINYLMTDEGYNPYFIRDLETLFDVMHIGPSIVGVNTSATEITEEKEKTYGDRYKNDPMGTDREWEAAKIVEINKSLGDGSADFKEVSERIHRLAAGIMYGQKTMAEDYKSVIGRVNVSDETGYRIETDKVRAIDCLNERPTSQLEILERITAKGIRAAVNTSLARLQAVKYNELLRDSARVSANPF